MGAYRLHLVHCDATLWCCRCTDSRRAFSTGRLPSTVTGRNMRSDMAIHKFKKQLLKEEEIRYVCDGIKKREGIT